VTKFAIAMVLNAVSYVVLLPSLSRVSVADGVNPDFLFALPFRTVSPNYLLLYYFVATCAELCVSPVGLSSFSRLAPARLAGMVMGTWFLGIAIGEYFAGRAAELSSSLGYGALFTVVIIGSLVISAALFAVAPAIRRLMSSEADPPAELPKAIAEPRDAGEGGRP
jgi:dipeptide/tripeptide permease